uniref:Uncharacterized protein n=1 Tax=Panagrolaimus sp. JU765 TaxID=591449 RepID=A0AC34RKH6_9BILA
MRTMADPSGTVKQINPTITASIVEDPKPSCRHLCRLKQQYPQARLETYYSNLVEQVEAAKNRFYATSEKREELEVFVDNLRHENQKLSDLLEESKQQEADAKEKEREIAEEFARLTDSRRHCQIGPLLRRSLDIGQELFQKLVRDYKIAEESHEVYQKEVERINGNVSERVVERNLLQERVLNLQIECEAEVEQKRLIYDETKDLEVRNEAFDAHIKMLTEWKQNLESQIFTVRSAIKASKKEVDVPVHETEKEKSKQSVKKEKYFDEVKEADRDNSIIVDAISDREQTLDLKSTQSLEDDKPSKKDELSMDVLSVDKSLKRCATCGGTGCDPVFGHQTISLPPKNPNPKGKQKSSNCLDSISVDCIAVASTASNTSISTVPVPESPLKEPLSKSVNPSDELVVVLGSSENLPKIKLPRNESFSGDDELYVDAMCKRFKGLEKEEDDAPEEEYAYAISSDSKSSMCTVKTSASISSVSSNGPTEIGPDNIRPESPKLLSPPLTDLMKLESYPPTAPLKKEEPPSTPAQEPLQLFSAESPDPTPPMPNKLSEIPSAQTPEVFIPKPTTSTPSTLPDTVAASKVSETSVAPTNQSNAVVASSKPPETTVASSKTAPDLQSQPMTSPAQDLTSPSTVDRHDKMKNFGVEIWREVLPEETQSHEDETQEDENKKI